MPMKDQDLKRLGRRELLEIIYAMKQTELSLRQELAQAQEELARRELLLSRSGSIAEAALALNGVFEAAQAAADDYLRSVKAMSAPQNPPQPSPRAVPTMAPTPQKAPVRASQAPSKAAPTAAPADRKSPARPPQRAAANAQPLQRRMDPQDRMDALLAQLRQEKGQ